MSPDRLRRYSSPTRGVRTTAPAESVVEHLEAFVPVLPRGCAFSHVTAARVLGLWLPTAWSAQEPVHIVLPDGLVRPRRRGVISHPVCTPRETTVTRGLRVTTAAETWVDLAAALDVDALVVAGDSALRFRGALCTPEDLDRSLGRLRRGVRRAREARELVRPGSASAMETLTRLLLVRAGLPEPELNGIVRGGDGTYVGAFDLVWRSQRVIVEYDGDQHRTSREQWQRDNRRLRLARALGWTVIVLTADDVLRTRAATVALVREALA